MKAARVDLYAFTGFPEGGGAQVDFVPKNRSAFLRAAKKAGLRLSPRKTVFLVQGSDKVGALTAALGTIDGARLGQVGINAVTAGRGRYGAGCGGEGECGGGSGGRGGGGWGGRGRRRPRGRAPR